MFRPICRKWIRGPLPTPEYLLPLVWRHHCALSANVCFPPLTPRCTRCCIEREVLDASVCDSLSRREASSEFATKTQSLRYDFLVTICCSYGCEAIEAKHMDDRFDQLLPLHHAAFNLDLFHTIGDLVLAFRSADINKIRTRRRPMINGKRLCCRQRKHISIL